MTCEHSFSSSVRVSFDIQEVVIKWSRKNPEETGTNCINTRVLTLQTHVLRKTSRLEEAARKLQNLEKRQKLRRAGKCRLRRVKFSFYRYSIRNKNFELVLSLLSQHYRGKSKPISGDVTWFRVIGHGVHWTNLFPSHWAWGSRYMYISRRQKIFFTPRIQ